MEKARLSGAGMVTALMVALSFAVACSGSSSSDDGGGGATNGNGRPAAETPIGQAFGGVGDLANEVVGKNQETYDGARHTASEVARALEEALGPPMLAVSAKGGGDEPCALGVLDGVEFAYTGSGYQPMGSPTAPSGSVAFRVYQIVDGLPNTDVVIGTLALSCTSNFQGTLLTATLQVGDVDVIRAVGYGQPDAFADAESVSVFQMQGHLANADGSQEIEFGPFGAASIVRYEGTVSDYVSFPLGQGMTADVSSYTQTAFESNLYITVFGGLATAQEFYFEASLSGSDGNLSGAGVFNFDQMVCCFDGTIENMTVSQASSSCDQFGYGYTPLPLPAGDIAAIQAGYDALVTMYLTVADVARAMGALANASARAVETQF